MVYEHEQFPIHVQNRLTDGLRCSHCMTAPFDQTSLAVHYARKLAAVLLVEIVTNLFSSRPALLTLESRAQRGSGKTFPSGLSLSIM